MATFSLHDTQQDWPIPHAASRALYERARVVEAGGAQGEGRGYLPYPIYIDRAEGARMWDVDGNELIDCHAAFSSVLLGHNHPQVRDAAIETLRTRGAGFSAAHKPEVDLAYALREVVPSAEMAAFSCTGTEATYHAIRLARAVTGRNKILKFEGCYHGWHDAVAWSTHFAPDESAGPAASPTPIAASSGIAEGARDGVVIREYNDVAGLETAIRLHRDELAAVILEPIAINGGHVEPLPEFLAALRTLTEEAGIVLIFDEIITGFRVGLGGAQERYGVTPDLTTLGKAFANGLPLSAVVGKERFMSRMATTGDVLFSGTHCGNVVNVSAALATLDVLRTQPIHQHLQDLGVRLADGIRAAIAETGAKAQIHQIGSIWGLHFTDKPIRTFRDLPFDQDGGRKYAHWPVSYRRWMLTQGVYIHPAYMVRAYLTAAHTHADIDRIVAATREFLVDNREALSVEDAG
ncbi:MAG TPA: aspartate aminotransferase family protein [Conexibacter sp.]|jgi:glutamate-1-semialdehyde 2,1-aminomutase|nr:aspartate aminotransferase family protein [Conexibacter sp.]